MEEINLKQKEFWSGSGGDVWVNKQSEMDIMLNPLGTKAISKLDLSKVTKIIDIGCGCGASTLEIAKQLGEGEIVGVDISEPMLARAARNASVQSLSNANFQVLDVQVDDMPSDFDIAFSRFGVMFFEDPYQAFSNIYNSLKENGQLNLLKGDDFILENTPLGFDIVIVNGHTEKQMLPMIRYKKKIIVFTGDLIPTVGHLPLAYVMGYDTRPLISLEEKNRFLKLAYEKQFLLFMEHDPFHELIDLRQTEKGIRMNENHTLKSFFE